MNNYTIYCTEEQTKKAIELGAPITINSWPPINDVKFMWISPPEDAIAWNNSTNGLIPTAEQMIGWLEEQGFYIRLSSSGGSVEIDFNCICEEVGTSRKEATLTVIDAALDYLINNDFTK